GQDLNKIVTIASLVEEESRVDDERPLVAAVVYHRLKQNMALGFDSTLQFALNKYGERMLDADKAVDSPYNTYLNAGLPPGPICSPGIKSLRAALNPADVDYLYFVSNADGKTHTFSRTYAEHNRAVADFRKKIAPQRKAE
ncbi:MAG: endolytic transglycosylase MltG, partial [FCB group bacterium]|nr:endolytic transglycosylase MltG [FCB group bacterium]